MIDRGDEQAVPWERIRAHGVLALRAVAARRERIGGRESGIAAFEVAVGDEVLRPRPGRSGGARDQQG